jgi:hypothetical protein
MKNWKTYIDEARGKSVEMILEHGKRIYEYQQSESEVVQGGSVFSERMNDWFGMSRSSSSHWALIGKHYSELFISNKQLPASSLSIYLLASKGLIAKAKPTMTQTEVRAMIKDVNGKEQAKKISRSWIGIALKEGILTPNQLNSKTKKKVQQNLQSIDPEIKFFSKGPTKEMAVRIEDACKELAARKITSDETTAAQTVAYDMANDLPKTAEQKLDSAIRAHKRYLDLKFEDRVAEQVRIDLEPMLKMYNEEHEKHVKANNSYRGVYELKEFKIILSALHADKYQGLSVTDIKRLNNAFNLIKLKEWELVGSQGDSGSNNSLPKTVVDLMQMRK